MACADDLAGQAGLTSGNAPGNLQALRSDYASDKRRGMMPVCVVAIHPDPNGGPPSADLQPLVHQADGLNRPTPHGTVYTATDGAGNGTTGTAALNVGAAGAPTITGTHATTDGAEAAVQPFAGVTVADPSAAAGAPRR